MNPNDMKSSEEEQLGSKTYLKKDMAPLEKAGIGGKDVEAIMSLLHDEQEAKRDEERLRELEEKKNLCPHCNKPLQVQDAVFVKTSQSVFVDYHRTYIGPGWRERSTYKNFELEYYRCQVCDRIIKDIELVNSSGLSRSDKDALISEIKSKTGIILNPFYSALQERAKGELQVAAMEKARKKSEAKFNKRMARMEKEIAKNWEGWHLPNSGESVQCNERGQNTFEPDSSLSPNTEQEIDKDVWTLLDFAKMKGKMQVGTFENKETGDSFKSCIFTDYEGNRTYVYFSLQLGVLTPAEIAAQKENLVVKKQANGQYILDYKNTVRTYQLPTT